MLRGNGCHVYPEGGRGPAVLREQLLELQNCRNQTSQWVLAPVRTQCRKQLPPVLRMDLGRGRRGIQNCITNTVCTIVSSGSGLAVARPIAADGEGRDAKSSPLTGTGDPSCHGELWQSLYRRGNHVLPGPKGATNINLWAHWRMASMHCPQAD